MAVAFLKGITKANGCTLKDIFSSPVVEPLAAELMSEVERTQAEATLVIRTLRLDSGDSNSGDGTTVGQGSSLIQVRARGDEGGENMRVVVNGQEIASIDVTTSWKVYDIRTDVYNTGDDVRVEFTNDQWDPTNGIDSNLYVDYVIANGEVCQTEDHDQLRVAVEQLGEPEPRHDLSQHLNEFNPIAAAHLQKKRAPKDSLS